MVIWVTKAAVHTARTDPACVGEKGSDTKAEDKDKDPDHPHSA